MEEIPETDSDQKEWYREAEDALQRAGDALKNAWDASRDARMSALESAKKAAQQLGEAIERGVAGAKGRWSDSEEDAAAEESEEE